VRHAKVGDADRGGEALLTRRLEPEPVVDALLLVERCVQQVQVRVRAEQLDAPLDRLQHDLGAVGQPLAVLARPHLGRDEDLFTRDARIPHGAADVLLVLVKGGGVKVPVAEPQRLGDYVVSRRAGWRVVETEAQHGDRAAVAEASTLRLFHAGLRRLLARGVAHALAVL